MVGSVQMEVGVPPLTRVEAALAYARQGWRVLPLHHLLVNGVQSCSCGDAECKAGGKREKNVAKHPRLSNWQSKASTDELIIRAWWKRWPVANIGIATGKESGIIVLDIDVHGDKRGFASLARLEVELGALPATRRHSTTSGGEHRFFRAPVFQICNSAGWRTFQGIDWRADGGQVVAPPSTALAGPYAVLDDCSIADLPQAWVEAHRSYEESRTSHKSAPLPTFEILPSTEFSSADDEEVLATARAAANGDKFRSLWNGRWSELGVYASQSEADLALCAILAFWTQDKDHVDRLFRRSGLMRPKWDEARGGETYGERTVLLAITREGERRDEERRFAGMIHPMSREFPSPPEPPSSQSSAISAPPVVANDGKKQVDSVANLLISIASGEDLFVDDRGEAYAHVKMTDHREMLPIRGRHFRHWIADKVYSRFAKAPGAEALGAAFNVVEAIARRGSARIALANRVARTADGAIWIDLVDAKWRAVRVTRDGWAVVNDPPPLFRRFRHQAPLPDPVRGGDLRDIFRYMNVPTGSQALFLGATVAALVPDIPQAIFILHGPQGAAKTVSARMRRSLIDPSIEESGMGKSDDAELAQKLDHNYMYILDNMKSLSSRFAEVLCQASTGGGFSKRQLYTDADDIIFTFRRQVTITCVSIPPADPDFMDRTVTIYMSRVAKVDRKREKVVRAAFDEARPALFGALLDTLSGAMRVVDDMSIDELPRLADFALWGAAACEILGYGASTFMCKMRENVNEKHAEIVDSDCVARSLILFIGKTKVWKGTTSELYDKLNVERGYRMTEQDWPKRSVDFGRRLTLLQPVLCDLGFTMEHAQVEGNDKQKQVWTISAQTERQDGEQVVIQ